MRGRIINCGEVIVSIEVPRRDGKPAPVVQGFESLAGYTRAVTNGPVYLPERPSQAVDLIGGSGRYSRPGQGSGARVRALRRDKVLGPANSDTLTMALHEAEMEIRHLRATIGALRQELEEQRAEKDQAVQQASVDAQGEITQLRDTVRALRAELESLHASKQEAVQKANADSAGEIGDLRRTVGVLRGQMEALKRDCEDRVSAVERASRGELKELQDTASALRGELERAHGR